MDALRGVGMLDTDAALSPSAVRRLACEAGIVPMVLGARSEVLDLGYTQRLITPAQRRALAARDQGCSYPGCTVPPMWCEAHHVTTGSTADPPTWATGPCSAVGTTPSSTSAA